MTLKDITKKLIGFYTFTGTIPYLRYVLFGVLLVVVIATAVGVRSCGTSDSELEKQAAEARNDATTQQANVETSAVVVEEKREAVKTSRKNSSKAIASAKEARTRAVRNVTKEEADQAREEAYPETKDQPVSDKTVTVSQDYYDSSVKAFQEVKVLRELRDTLVEERDKQADLIAAQDELGKAKDRLIESKDRELEALRKLKCEETKFLWGVVKKKKCK